MHTLYILCFLQKYYLELAKQLAAKKKKQKVGNNLSAQLLENFSDEQVVQLVELFNVAADRKTSDSKSS